MGNPGTAKPPGFLSRTLTTPTLYRNYRLIWMGSWSEHLGEWLETTALLWLLNQMTHSPLMLTLMVTLRYLPMTVFAFVGGIVALVVLYVYHTLTEPKV